MEIFEQKALKNGQIITRWMYCYTEAVTGKKHKRICKNCNSRKDAEAYVSKLIFVDERQWLIKNIAADMFIPESNHMKRMSEFGKNISEETREQKRYFIKLIIEKWGEHSIRELKISEIERYLLDEHKKHSGSWKNFYLETFGNIYDETIWKCPEEIRKPKFQRFARNSRKSDVFSTEELNKFFDIDLWNDYQQYLLFLITASCGLRLGEARGLKVEQFNFKEEYIIVNGFCKRGGFKTDYNKKGNSSEKKYRIVPLPVETSKKLKNYIESHNLKSDDFLFTHFGKPYTQSSLRSSFLRIIDLLDLNPDGKRKLSPHSLRFTYVTRMRRTLPVEDVRKLVGHNSTEMTEYYTVPSIPEMKYLINKSKDASNGIFKM